MMKNRNNDIDLAGRGISPEKLDKFRSAIISWYKENGRHHFPWRKKGLTDYEIITAEVLLQRTKAETVEKRYQDFLGKFPDWLALDTVSYESLQQHIKPLGLSSQRAKRLKSLAAHMRTRNGILPAGRSDLDVMPCLGQYIANAIELQIFQRRKPLLDVNMARVLERYFGQRQLSDIRYDPYLQRLAHAVIDHQDSKHINWAILDFAALVCKARQPLCKICVVADSCKYHQENLT